MLWAFLVHSQIPRDDLRVVFFEDGEFAQEVSTLGIHTSVIPSGRLRDPKRLSHTVYSLSKVFTQHAPDAILNWSPKTQLYGAAAATIAGMSDRVLWWQHGVPTGQWMDRAATALPTKAIGCSSLASATAQRKIKPGRLAFVVHPGVPFRAAPKPAERLDARLSLGIRSDETVLGIVGRLQPWKGQDRFLHMLATLRAHGRRVHGVLVGGDAYGLSSAYAEGLSDLVTTLGLADAVTLTGQVDDALPYMRAMDVIVSASSTEPFGIVLLEAMSLAIPPVAVASGGPREIIEPRRSGLLVDGPTIDQLSAAVDELVVNPELRARLGNNARRRVLDHFTVEQMAVALDGYIERIATA